ncbi:unnamed protein product [Peniophora sp. CBMAI 1063]|nr:unnamed protein product [Peniophora sp. CBMAI 1063]
MDGRNGEDLTPEVPPFDIDDRSLSNNRENMHSAMLVIENVLKMLRETDSSSHKALCSMSYPDGKHALEMIDPSLHSLGDISEALERISGELGSRRTAISRVVNPIHNQKLPVASLPPDVLHIIFEEVAFECRPHSGLLKLGWIVLAHVCTSWRNLLLSMSNLWAREVGAFRSAASFQEIANRARMAPMSVSNPWAWFDHEPLPDHYWPIISQISNIKAICFTPLHPDNVQRLANILAGQSSTMLRSLALLSRQEHYEITLPSTFHCPNLRWASFENTFIPFDSHHLVGLLIVGSSHDAPAGVNLDQFLDVLQTCSSLSILCLKLWAPRVLSVTTSRTVHLPGLQTVAMSDHPGHTSFIDICIHLSLPLLSYLFLDVDQSPVPDTVPTIMSWLLSGAQIDSPCMKNASRLSVTSTGHSVSSWVAATGHNDFRVRIDNGRLKRMSPSLYFEFPIEENRWDQCGVGVHMHFLNMVGGDGNPVTDTTFFRTVTRGWTRTDFVDSASRPTIKSAYFDSQLTAVDWDAVFEDLTGVETLYISDFPYIWDEPGGNRDDGLLSALSRIVQSNGTMLLPRLRNIVCGYPSFLDAELRDEEPSRNAGRLVREMLRSRAEHGMPIRSMRIRTRRVAPEDDNSDKETNEQLQNLVDSYL